MSGVSLPSVLLSSDLLATVAVKAIFSPHPLRPLKTTLYTGDTRLCTGARVQPNCSGPGCDLGEDSKGTWQRGKKERQQGLWGPALKLAARGQYRPSARPWTGGCMPAIPGQWEARLAHARGQLLLIALPSTSPSLQSRGPSGRGAGDPWPVPQHQ